MILTAVAALLSVGAPSQADAVQLARTFKAGEKLEYAIQSNLQSQHRQRGLETWIPEDLDINYRFTTEVKAVKSDGIVDLVYQRPTMTIVTGETFNSPPKTQVEKTKLNFLLTVSPANEILNQKDLNPPEKKKPGTKDDGIRFMTKAGAGKQAIPFIGQFIGEVQRLCLFVGSFDSALDFAPRLPFEKLKVGDTWKRTVGYTPQKLKGKDGKTVVQRLDYTFTYKGLMESNGKQIYRIVGTCGFDSNLADFINETFDVNSEVTGIKSIPLNFKAQIDFDLDKDTKKTLAADAQSEGGFKILLTAFPDPVEEETFKGKTRLRLVSQTIVKPTKKS